LTPSANANEIDVAFKKLALKNHPIWNSVNIHVCSEDLHKICEAYEVLSNP